MTPLGWHVALVHLSIPSMRKMATSVDGIDKMGPSAPLNPCDACAQGKLTRASFRTSQSARYTRKLGLLHIDICGSMQEIFFSGMNDLHTNARLRQEPNPPPPKDNLTT